MAGLEKAEKLPKRSLVRHRRGFRIKLMLTFVSLRHRNYRIYWFSQLVSLTGTWMQSVAQGWLVYQLTNSPLALGLIGFSTALPVLLFSLLSGAVIDRVNKRNLIVTTQSLAALQAFVLAALAYTGLIRFWHVAVAALGLGAINAFDNPARQSFVVEMVGKKDLMNAIALNSSVFNASRIFGPAIAGVLVAAIGPAGCFLLNGISFLVAIFGLLTMRLPPYVGASKKGSVWHNIIEGLSYILGSSVIRSLISLVLVSSLFGFSYAALMPVFARDILKVGASGLGLLMASVGAGALVGALTLASLSHLKRRGWLLTFGNLFFPAMIIGFSLSRSFVLSLLFLAGVGLGMITQNATANTLLQTTVPDHLRGRVMSVHTLMFMGMLPFGNLQAGTVAEHFGAPVAVGVGGIVCSLFSLFVLWRMPQVRRLS